MDIKELLISAIQNYEKGGLQNEEFLKAAHKIYNAYATYPFCLFYAEHPYLLGIVYSYFAKYYEKQIDYYTCIMENALFCFGKVMEASPSQSERQCAAIRMLLLIDDNDWVMKGIAHTFFEKRCQELYGAPLMVQMMMAQGMDKWTYENDILKNIGSFCIEKSSSADKHSSISSMEMRRFKNIVNSGKYNVEWPLVSIPKDRVYALFFNHICQVIRTPYERRDAQLRYNGN